MRCAAADSYAPASFRDSRPAMERFQRAVHGSALPKSRLRLTKRAAAAV